MLGSKTVKKNIIEMYTTGSNTAVTILIKHEFVDYHPISESLPSKQSLTIS